MERKIVYLQAVYGGVPQSAYKIKTRFYFVYRSACTTFIQKMKVGGVSEEKINAFILFFSQLALPLFKK